jgi:rubrerythrin
MSIFQRLTGTVSKPTYVCRFCRLSFEKERANCPACGCDEISAD